MVDLAILRPGFFISLGVRLASLNGLCPLRFSRIIPSPDAECRLLFMVFFYALQFPSPSSWVSPSPLLATHGLKRRLWLEGQQTPRSETTWTVHIPEPHGREEIAHCPRERLLGVPTPR